MNNQQWTLIFNSFKICPQVRHQQVFCQEVHNSLTTKFSLCQWTHCKRANSSGEEIDHLVNKTPGPWFKYSVIWDWYGRHLMCLICPPVICNQHYKTSHASLGWLWIIFHSAFRKTSRQNIPVRPNNYVYPFPESSEKFASNN